MCSLYPGGSPSAEEQEARFDPITRLMAELFHMCVLPPTARHSLLSVPCKIAVLTLTRDLEIAILVLFSY